MLAAKREAAAGRGVLVVERNVVTHLYATSPLRLLAPKNAGSAVWVFAATFGGGLLPGDHIDLDVTLGAGTTALVGTQSQTKVFRGGGASQTARAALADDALLVWLPDPVCCFAGATWTQSLTVNGGSAVILEGLTAGRIARGERWQFARYAARTRVGSTLDDALLLDPAHGELASRLRDCNLLATIIAVGPRAAPVAEHLRAAAAGFPLRAPVRVACNDVAGGALVRIAATTTEHATRAVRQLLGPLPALLGDDPFARKW